MADFIDKLAFICIKDKKLLSTMSRGKDVWFTPGGKREAGETDEQALTREVKEELNVDLVPESIKYFATFQAQAHGKPEGVMVRMTCYTASYTGEPQASSEIEKIAYLPYTEKAGTSLAAQLIFDDLYEKGLIA